MIRWGKLHLFLSKKRFNWNFHLFERPSLARPITSKLSTIQDCFTLNLRIYLKASVMFSFIDEKLLNMTRDYSYRLHSELTWGSGLLFIQFLIIEGYCCLFIMSGTFRCNISKIKRQGKKDLKDFIFSSRYWEMWVMTIHWPTVECLPTYHITYWL